MSCNCNEVDWKPDPMPKVCIGYNALTKTHTQCASCGHEPACHFDNVHNPAHYTGKGMEVIDVIEAFGLGFNLGNALKYILRHDKKNGKEDLAKAINYLHREATGKWQQEK